MCTSKINQQHMCTSKINQQHMCTSKINKQHMCTSKVELVASWLELCKNGKWDIPLSKQLLCSWTLARKVNNI